MKQPSPNLVSLAAGTIFGVGVVLSGLASPQVILGSVEFFREWDPTFYAAFAVAVTVYAAIRHYAHRRGRPLAADRFHEPTSRAITARLVIGSAIFGIGWGVAGMCPGASLAAGGLGTLGAWAYLGFLGLGIVGTVWTEARIHELSARRRGAATAASTERA